jgi:hypothetical protein
MYRVKNLASLAVQQMVGPKPCVVPAVDNDGGATRRVGGRRVPHKRDQGQGVERHTVVGPGRVVVLVHHPLTLHRVLQQQYEVGTGHTLQQQDVGTGSGTGTKYILLLHSSVFRSNRMYVC